MWGFPAYVLCGTALQSPLNIAVSRTVAPPAPQYGSPPLKANGVTIMVTPFSVFMELTHLRTLQRDGPLRPSARYPGDFFSKAIAISKKTDKPLVCALVRFDCFYLCGPAGIAASLAARARFSGGVPGFRIGRSCRNPRPQGKPYGGSAQ